MTTQIIIVEEPGPLGPDLARILNHRGFKATAAADISDALELIKTAAPNRAAVFVSAELASRSGNLFDALLRQEPRPIVRLTCTGAFTCPMNPGLLCPGLDCFQKPLDFADPSLGVRVRAMLAAEASTPVPVMPSPEPPPSAPAISSPEPLLSKTADALTALPAWPASPA